MGCGYRALMGGGYKTLMGVVREYMDIHRGYFL